MAGHKKVAMGELCALATGLGFAGAKTLLNSGNLIFTSAARKTAGLEALLEKEIAGRLGVETCVMVRSAAEWQDIVAANPLLDDATRAPNRFAVMFLKDAPAKPNLEALKAAITGTEYFKAGRRELYAFFPDGFANTKFTTALIDRTLKTTVTARNWNTVLKLATLSQVRDG